MLQARREFISKLAALVVVAKMPGLSIIEQVSTGKIEALAFDAFPIFDPRPVFALTEQLFPGKGNELNNVWRSRQFEYQWLRTLSGQYRDFWNVTQDALVFAAKTANVELTEEKRAKLMNAFLDLKVWPDVIPALQAFKSAGIKLVFLSNMTEGMLRHNMRNNDLDHLFDNVFSTDSIHSYKPAPGSYRIAVSKLKIDKSKIGFVAFAGWDAAGAKSFGYPTYWINRLDQPAEELGVLPDWTGVNLSELVNHLRRSESGGPRS